MADGALAEGRSPSPPSDPRRVRSHWRTSRRLALSAISNGHSRQRYDELNTFNVLTLEPIVVGDEQIHACAGGAGQLNCVGGLQRSLRSQGGVELGCFHLERDQGCYRRNCALILLATRCVLALNGFYQDFAQREGRSQQLIAAVEHLGAKLADGLGEGTVVLEEIDEEVGVPKNATHSQPSRNRRT